MWCVFCSPEYGTETSLHHVFPLWALSRLLSHLLLLETFLLAAGLPSCALCIPTSISTRKQGPPYLSVSSLSHLLKVPYLFLC